MKRDICPLLWIIELSRMSYDDTEMDLNTCIVVRNTQLYQTYDYLRLVRRDKRGGTKPTLLREIYNVLDSDDLKGLKKGYVLLQFGKIGCQQRPLKRENKEPKGLK